MTRQLHELVPKVLWKNFESICAIPHPSKKEDKIIGFVEDFARKHQLAYKKDGVGNVVVGKPATQGNERKPGIVLQAHLDMAPQKNADTMHDFEKDPIQAYVDGEWVKAKGTTLGADDGIGVAAGLAVLESTDLSHGPLEVLFTVDEETGMTGAFNLTHDFLKGRIFLNLDSEDEGELYVGCAGGVNTTATFAVKPEPTPLETKSFKISLTGLNGGHSGVDIHLGRANANKLMNRLLWKASRENGLRIATIAGGSLRNAIARESFVTVVAPENNEKEFYAWIAEFHTILQEEFLSIEPDLKLEIIPTDRPETVFDNATQDRFLNAIYAAPNGVIRVSSEVPGIVETSTNLAIVKTAEDRIEINCLLRSSIDSAKADLCNVMTSIFELAGASVVHEGSYPGWKPDFQSPLLTTMKKVYKAKFSCDPKVKVIHAGLECGIIGDKYKSMDMISFGPTIRYPHSPSEKVNIASVEKFWVYLTEALGRI